MAPPKRPSPSSRVLNNAKQVHDNAQRFVDKHSKGIDRDYQAAKAAYGHQAAKTDEAYKTLSGASIFNDVSNGEADAVLRSLGINPNTGRSAAPMRSASAPLPSRPTTIPSARRSPAPTSTTGSSNDKFLRAAEKMAKEAEAKLAKQRPQIQAAYDEVSRQASALGRDIDRVQEVLSRPMRSSSVSADEVDELMSQYTDAVRLEQKSPKRTASQAGFQSPPAKRQAQSAEDRATQRLIAKMPSAPTHELKSPAPTVNPNQAKIDALQKQAQQFENSAKALASATTKSELMPALKAAVTKIDSVSGTNSMAHYKKLEARFDDLSQQKEAIVKLGHRVKVQPSQRGALEAAKEKFTKDNDSLQQDLKAYKDRVIGACKNESTKCDKKIADLKTAPGPSQDNDNTSSSNNTPRPRGPGR